MREKLNPTLTYYLDAICECGSYFEFDHTEHYKKYVHICNACNKQEVLSKIYPIEVIKRIEG